MLPSSSKEDIRIALYMQEQQPELERLYAFGKSRKCAALYLLNEKTSFDASERMKGHFWNNYGQTIRLAAEILTRGRFMNIDLRVDHRGGIKSRVCGRLFRKTLYCGNRCLNEQEIFSAKNIRNFCPCKSKKTLYC